MSDEQSLLDEVTNTDSPNAVAEWALIQSRENILIGWSMREDDFWRCYWDER